MRIAERRSRGGGPVRGSAGVEAVRDRQAPVFSGRASALRVRAPGTAPEDWADPRARAFRYGVAGWNAAIDAVARDERAAVGTGRAGYEVWAGVLHCGDERAAGTRGPG